MLIQKCVQRVCNFDCSQRCSGNAEFTLIMRKTQRECANRRCNWRSTLRKYEQIPQKWGVPKILGSPGWGPVPGDGYRSPGPGTGPRGPGYGPRDRRQEKKASFCKGENPLKPKGTKEKKEIAEIFELKRVEKRTPRCQFRPEIWIY